MIKIKNSYILIVSVSIFFTFYLSYYLIASAKRDISEVISATVRNNLMIMDYRDAIINLEKSTKSYFHKIAFFSTEDILVFDVGRQLEQHSFYFTENIVLFQDSEKNNKFGTLKFYYTLNPYLPFFLFILCLEISIFIILYSRSLKKIELDLEKNLKIQQLIFMTEISNQVAHDIRSPLSTLNILVSEKIDISSEYKDLMKSVTSRINSIADNLLDKSKSFSENATDKLNESNFTKLERSTRYQNISLNEVVYKIVNEKKIMHPDYLFEIRNTSYFSEVNFENTDLERIISNLINNSIDAAEENKSIYISITNINQTVVLSIVDFGYGISQEIINLLGEEKFTTKGNQGNGLGLYHAFKKMKEWGGHISIQSKLNVGTKIDLIWPME